MAIITAQAELPKASPAQPQRQIPTLEDPKVDAEVPAQSKEPDISAKLAMLARKEKAMRAELQAEKEALRAEREAFKSTQDEYKTKYIPKEDLLKDPFSILNKEGLDYSKLTEMMLNGPTPTEQQVSSLVTRIQELEAKLDKQASAATETQTKAYEQAVNSIRNEAKVLIDSDPAFSTIKDTESIEAVVELIKQTHASTGLIMTTKDAANEVEQYLIDEAVKMASLEKVKQKLTPQQEQAVQQPQKASSERPQQMKTLTNAVSASSKPLTAKERAVLAFKGQLK